jgi:hypothetical protein
MESVTYEGLIPVCIDIRLIIVKAFFALRRKISGVLFLNLRVEGRKGKQKIGMKNQLSYLTVLEADNNFSDVFKEGHHDSCVT